MAISKITTTSITDGTIATADIADSAISTAKIADDAVTSAKATGVGGGTIVVQAKNNSSQTISNTTTTKLTVDTEIIDTASEFDPSTSRYTPANGHYVMFIEYAGYPAGSSARGFSFKVYKNGSSVYSSNMYSNNNAHFFGNSDNNGKTITYYFEQTTATDYYEFYVYANTNSVNWNSSELRLTVFKK